MQKSQQLECLHSGSPNKHFSLHDLIFSLHSLLYMCVNERKKDYSQYSKIFFPDVYYRVITYRYEVPKALTIQCISIT